MNQEHVDVIIVGAGISGIGAAYHLQQMSPSKSFLILEGRENLGGTWDLFKYPGVRSDSDMHTLGYSFKPWTGRKAIADGQSILNYLTETAQENGIDKKIRYGKHVKGASWCSGDERWSLDVETVKDKDLSQFTCSFLFMCSGYYDYSDGYRPQFTGLDTFSGQLVHPQNWPEDLDCSGKRVVVIGSGATAVTLIPELAKCASHITMLQRSPTYVVSQPEEDDMANSMHSHLPAALAHSLTRWKNILYGILMFLYVKRYPQKTKESIIDSVRKELPDFDVDKHFTPRYMPWDQRVCVVPNGDLFSCIRAKKAVVVTDQIDEFVAEGIKLKSGEILGADIVVTATGLNMQFLSDITLSVDGVNVAANELMTYKGLMFSGVPNLALASGYVAASWTLKCDLTSTYVCRILNYMDKKGYRQCRPERKEGSVDEDLSMSFTSGYVQRAIHKFPRQGLKFPWRLYENYVMDRLVLKYSRLKDDVMKFS